MKKLYSGDCNDIMQEWQPDGSVVITLTKRGENKTYRFHVEDLYGENEKVLKHEVIEHETPKHIKDRMKEAKKD